MSLVRGLGETSFYVKGLVFYFHASENFYFGSLAADEVSNQLNIYPPTM